MLCLTGAGGGYGDPMEREPWKVRDDVLDRKVSAEKASEMYGVVLDQATGEVDDKATETLRATMRKARGPISWTYDLGEGLGVL